jgi:hypothetical protein
VPPPLQPRLTGLTEERLDDLTNKLFKVYDTDQASRAPESPP